MNEMDFTVDWFSTNSEAMWPSQLAELRDVGFVRALEVGSYEGMSACWLIEHFNRRSIHVDCIDIFNHCDYESRFLHNTAMYRQNGLLRQLKGCSTARLADLILRRASYNFIYIDGDHECLSVICDAVMAFRLLEVGGKMCFDDYEWDQDIRHLPPKPAIDAFLHCHSDALEVTHKGYQIWIRKTREI